MNKNATISICTLGLTLGIVGISEAYRGYRNAYARYSRAMSGYGLRHEAPRNSYDVGAIYQRTRGHHGTLSEDNVRTFQQEFRGGQSVRGLYSALGYPNESRSNRDVWLIQKKDFYGRPTGRYGRMIAEYREDGSSTTWSEW